MPAPKRSKGRSRTKQTIKIADLQRELKLSDSTLHYILRQVNIRLTEGQKNLDTNEAGRIRQHLNEQRRREELKQQQIRLPSIVKVQELSRRLGISVGEVLGVLLKNGVTATLNDDLDYETGAIVAAELGYTTEEDVTELEKETLTPEKLAELLSKEDAAQQRTRPPVVTIMGHVDHGKTTLLDAIRKTNVVATEVGGITQAISSYQVEYKGRPITFIDTPGHETFKFMRKRGASLADIGILVVAADDGVMPQTVEAISHVREAGVPIVVAINKIDKPGANLDKVKKELSELELQPEEWGGKTVIVPVSALTRAGIDELLDMILLTADLNPPKAVFDRPALASVIESRLDRNLGSIATVLVHTGTLKVGDYVVVGRAVGRVRRLLDFRNRPVPAAGPAAPVTIVGLSRVPQAGDILQVVEEQEEARFKAASQRAPIKRLASTDDEDTRPSLALLLKSDSQGSLEAIEQTVRALVPEELRLSIIRSEVGNISDSDVLTAQAADAIIYGFNVAFSGMAQRLADKEHVPVRLFNIIYRLSEDARREVEERLPVDIVRTPLGRLKVLKVFFSTPKRKIVGGEVAQGTLEPKTSAIVWRKEGGKTTEIGHGTISEMQIGQQSLKKAETGDQVGITYEGKGKIKEGDVLEVYKEEKVKRKLEKSK